MVFGLILVIGLALVGCADLSVESVPVEVGLDWRRLESTPRYTMIGIAASDSLFVLLSPYGRVYASVDGVSWDTTLVTDDFILYSLSRAGGRFFVVGNGFRDRTPLLMASSNGIDWVRGTGGLPNFWDNIGGPPFQVIHNGTEYLAINRRGGIMASSDALNWVVRLEPESGRFITDVVAGNGLLVAVGSNATDSRAMAAVSDGHGSWSLNPLSATSVAQPEAIIFDGERFIACGRQSLQNIARGGIITSPDGLNWSDLELGIKRSLLDIVRHPSRLIAVGNDGTIVTSPDGNVWTFRATGSYQDLRNIAVTRDRAMVIGTSGITLVSP